MLGERYFYVLASKLLYIASVQDAAIVGTRVDIVTHKCIIVSLFWVNGQAIICKHDVIAIRLGQCEYVTSNVTHESVDAWHVPYVDLPSWGQSIGGVLLYQRGTYISWYIYMESINTRIKHPLEKFSEMVHITSTLQPLRQLIFLLLLHRHTGTMHGQ